MLERQRHQLILDTLEEGGYASVRELTDLTGASEATLRRDLNKLAGAGRLHKLHGGAQALSAQERVLERPQLAGYSFLASREVHASEKQWIARRAVELCADGDAIIINGGSSTFMMAEALRERQLNILTNSFPLAMELVDSDNRVSLPGGEIHRKQNIILSAFDDDGTANYVGSRMFMGTPGITPFGVMESAPLLIQAERKLRRQAEQLVVLADSSKISSANDASGNLVFCPLADIDVLVTDAGLDAQCRDMLESAGIEVLLARSGSAIAANE
ncbi:MAG: DeoR/GlpR transcriptional regulator [Halioglobus sp.]|nr:DeoR/GlpR transcriptional regulator [Halioglobus sp.]